MKHVKVIKYVIIMKVTWAWKYKFLHKHLDIAYAKKWKNEFYLLIELQSIVSDVIDLTSQKRKIEFAENLEKK